MKSDHTILTLKRSWLHHTDLEQEKLTTSYWPWTGETDHIILTLNRRSWPHHTDLEQDKLIISYWPWTGDVDHILTLNRCWSHHTDLEQEKLTTSYWPWTGEVDHNILTLNREADLIILTLSRRVWPHHTEEKTVLLYYADLEQKQCTASYWPSKRKELY